MKIIVFLSFFSMAAFAQSPMLAIDIWDSDGLSEDYRGANSLDKPLIISNYFKKSPVHSQTESYLNKFLSSVELQQSLSGLRENATNYSSEEILCFKNNSPTSYKIYEDTIRFKPDKIDIKLYRYNDKHSKISISFANDFVNSNGDFLTEPNLELKLQKMLTELVMKIRLKNSAEIDLPKECRNLSEEEQNKWSSKYLHVDDSARSDSEKKDADAPIKAKVKETSRSSAVRQQ